MLNKLLARLFTTRCKNSSELESTLLSAQNYHQQGLLEEAAKLYQKVLRTDPSHFDALQLLGLLKHQQGQHDASIELLTRAITINPHFYAVYVNLGTTLKSLHRYEEALRNYNIALSLQPDNPTALTNQAGVLFEIQQYEAALESCNKVLALINNDILALITRGNALMKMERYSEALASYEQALTYANLDSSTSTQEEIDLLHNKGQALFELKRYDDALNVFETMLVAMPNHADALCSRGNCLFHLKQFGEAINSFEKSLSINPHCAAAHLNQGLCRLLIGDFERGWEEYEWRAKKDDGQYKYTLSAPLWDGSQSLNGKTIFVYAEQGLGDTILALRYIHNISALGASIILDVQPPLKSIASSLKNIDHLLIQKVASLPYDYHCPLMSLPLAFKTDITSIPAEIPYLFSKPEQTKHWQERLKSVVGKRIGIVWSGNPDNKTDQSRSIELTQMLRLKQNHITMICLKKEISALDKKILDENNIAYFDNDLHDFSDTAALIECLDVIICVDTSVAHLAGAMGKTVWILLAHNADWRWLLGRTDSPWYPTARLFRQQHSQSWDDVLTDVSKALAQV